MASKYKYLTDIQAETLARLYYGLGLRKLRGCPKGAWQKSTVEALKKKLLIDQFLRVTDRGVRELAKYCREWVK
jgi:hypothetical protein